MDTDSFVVAERGRSGRADRWNDRRRGFLKLMSSFRSFDCVALNARRLLLADNAGKGTRKRVHPGRTRFGANATRSVERSQVVVILNFYVECYWKIKLISALGRGCARRESGGSRRILRD